MKMTYNNISTYNKIRTYETRLFTVPYHQYKKNFENMFKEQACVQINSDTSTSERL